MILWERALASKEGGEDFAGGPGAGCPNEDVAG
jgi:hypothetical protein